MSWISILVWAFEYGPEVYADANKIIGVIHTLPFFKNDPAQTEISNAIKAGDSAAAKEAIQTHAGMVGNPTGLV